MSASALCQTDKLLAALNNCVKLVESPSGRPEFLLEPIGDSGDFSDETLRALANTYDDLNLAIQRGVLELSPVGHDDLDPIDLPAALEVLAPGWFDATTVAKGGTDSSGEPLIEEIRGRKIKVQWLPPGMRIRFTRRGTNTLIAALANLQALLAFLALIGVAAPLAAVIAVAIQVAGAAIRAMQAISRRGTIGIKIIFNLPLPGMVTVIPFPT